MEFFFSYFIVNKKVAKVEKERGKHN